MNPAQCRKKAEESGYEFKGVISTSAWWSGRPGCNLNIKFNQFDLEEKRTYFFNCHPHGTSSVQPNVKPVCYAGTPEKLPETCGDPAALSEAVKTLERELGEEKERE